MEKCSGKHITLRDITNMNARLRPKGADHNNLVKTVEYLNGITGNNL